MKATLFLSFGAHAAAQVITAVPAQILNRGFDAALNVDDPEFEICANLDKVLRVCLDDAGGIIGVDTDKETAMNCVCCQGSNALAKDYSTCASYYGGLMTDADLEPLSTMYSMCSESVTCSGSGTISASSASGFASASASASASATVSSVTQRGAPSMSASSASAVTSPPKQDSGAGDGEKSCQSMSDMFLSCINETPGFDKLGYKSQAACYCCGGRNEAFWTDSLDQAASSCWDWAESSQIGSVWNYAKTFATFCDNFSDACDGGISPKTKDSNDEATEPTQTGNKEAKETGSNDNADEKEDEDGAAGHVRPGSMVGVAVLVGALLTL